MKKRVLLVDDSATVLLMEKMILNHGPFEVMTAVDGAHGVEVARTELPDLILMDLIMPKMDGFEAVRQLKADPTTKAIPVIMVTTKAEEEKVRTAEDIGCAGYVTKPISGPELMAKIRSTLGV